MKTTVPISLAKRGESRAREGLFASGDVEAVIGNLQQDLIASGYTEDSLTAQYMVGAGRYRTDVEDDDAVAKLLRERARSSLRALLEGKLPSDDLPSLVEILYFAGHQRTLAKHHIRFPAYNMLDEYFTNVTAPWGPSILPRPRANKRGWSLFGRRIGFPIGVPASVLTGNSKWVQYFASNGFNVLTYKTVRSRPHAPNEAPNWAFVPEVSSPWDITDEHYSVQADPWDWVNPGQREVTTANSFGVPSPEPREWMADLENALTVLADDQLLIVSVMGDDYDSDMPQLASIKADFARTAQLAETAGASIIELNLSCPNSLYISGGVKPPICFDADITTEILETVRTTLSGKTQIVAKLSYLDEDRLCELVPRIAPLVDGIAGINTLQCTVRRSGSTTPTFPNRELAGVSGIAVQQYARDFIARLARLRVETDHYFEILGMGGVTDPESFQVLYELGASAVQTASGAFANPFLATECVEALGSSLPETPDIHDGLLVETIFASIAAAKKAPLSRSQLIAALPLRAAQAARLIDRFEKVYIAVPSA